MNRDATILRDGQLELCISKKIGYRFVNRIKLFILFQIIWTKCDDQNQFLGWNYLYSWSFNKIIDHNLKVENSRELYLSWSGI